MTDIRHIYETIRSNGFADAAICAINNYINDIQNGRTDFPRFTQPEHAGLCTAGAPLLGASIVASYATASLGAGGDASGGEGIREMRQRPSSSNFWSRLGDESRQKKKIDNNKRYTASFFRQENDEYIEIDGERFYEDPGPSD